METRFKLRLSRMFQSSFASCRRSRNLSDIIHKAVFLPSSDDSAASFRKLQPDFSDSTDSLASSSRDFLLPRRKIFHRFPLAPFPSAISGGRTCPPASPISPSKPISKKTTTITETAKNKKKKKKKKQRKQRKKENPFCNFDSSNFGGTWWYSSEEEEEEDDETDTLFSSKSRSSDSSASHRRRQKSRRRRGSRSRGSEMGVLPLKGKVKDSFAVVKKSSDPYNDFRSSMLEMIVEKRIFSAEDLEQLLQCFLSLNSDHHHNVILEVFTEIWEALFSDWGS